MLTLQQEHQIASEDAGLGRRAAPDCSSTEPGDDRARELKRTLIGLRCISKQA